MSFLMLFFILAWLVGWPILSYLYVKHTYGIPEPVKEGPKRIQSGKIKITPITNEHETVVAMKIGNQVYIGEDRDITDLLRRLKATQMTVRTMNEVQELDTGEAWK